MAVAQKIAELKDRGKGGQVRALLRGAGIGGARLLAGSGVFSRAERGRISKLMEPGGAKDFKQFTAALENMGYKVGDAVKKKLEKGYLAGDVEDVQKSLFMRKTQQGPTTAVGILKKLDGTLDKMVNIAKAQTDAIVAVGLKDEKLLKKYAKSRGFGTNTNVRSSTTGGK
jgi:hypothetical protein